MMLTRWFLLLKTPMAPGIFLKNIYGKVVAFSVVIISVKKKLELKAQL